MEELTTQEKKELYKTLQEKILNNKQIFQERKFKDTEVIQILLDIILNEEGKVKGTDKSILRYIDFKGIDMKDQNLIHLDMTGTNIEFDPQTIKDKDLQHAKLIGDFKGKSFDGVHILGTDFSQAINVKINPQKVKNKKILNAIVDGVDFCNESFEEVEYSGTDFTNAKNCELTKGKFYVLKKRILNNSK